MGDNPGTVKTIDAVERASELIEVLRELDGAGVTEIAEQLDISKSGVHKQLSTLVETGFVTKTGHEYQLSFRFLLMGEHVKANSSLYNIGASEVDSLAEESGYFAYLTVMDHNHTYCIHTAEGERAVSPNVRVGKELSLHSTAAGKAVLAGLPAERRTKLLTKDLGRMTAQTVTDRETLERELERAVERGVTFEDEENVSGMRGVGAPIESGNGQVVGAVAVTGPVSLLTDEHFEEELPRLVKQTKNVIEVKFSVESRDPLKDGSQPPKDLY